MDYKIIYRNESGKVYKYRESNLESKAMQDTRNEEELNCAYVTGCEGIWILDKVTTVDTYQEGKLGQIKAMYMKEKVEEYILKWSDEQYNRIDRIWKEGQHKLMRRHGEEEQVT